jgi:hypothetical protein
MSDFPLIRTAIPRRRYRVGEYAATLLSEVESGDGKDYQFILAFVEEGGKQPVLFVCLERNPPGRRANGSHCLRIVNAAMSEVLGSSDHWRAEEAFAEEGLAVGVKMLGLKDEMVSRLL